MLAASDPGRVNLRVNGFVSSFFVPSATDVDVDVDVDGVDIEFDESSDFSGDLSLSFIDSLSYSLMIGVAGGLRRVLSAQSPYGLFASIDLLSLCTGSNVDGSNSTMPLGDSGRGGVSKLSSIGDPSGKVAIGWPSTIDALRHTCFTRGPFKSMRCRFARSAVPVDVGGTAELVVAAAAAPATVVVVAFTSRSFFRRRNRDVSSTSTTVVVEVVAAAAAVDFFGLAADGAVIAASGGDIC